MVRSEEVEFDQAGLLDMLHRVLGDQEVGFRVAVERDQFDQRAVADDDAGRMGGGMAVETFDAQGDFQQSADGFVFVAQACRRGSPSTACCSVTGLAGLLGSVRRLY